ncbi:MAG: VOC family protein [Vicingaceae bacterium]
MSKGKVNGIGGIFFKCQDPNSMKDWYKNQLGIKTDKYGALFEFRKADGSDKPAYLQWSPFDADTKYFDPSEKEFMINYRVENMEALVDELKSNGVKIVDEIEEFEYGKFVHIMDLEGNKIELWEPVDQVFTDSYEGETTK